MYGTIKGIRIEGVATSVPSYVEDNLEHFAEILGEKRCKKQIRLTGIKSRHLSVPSQKSSDLAIEAAKHLMDKLEIQPEDIKALVYVTQTPTFHSPSTAFFIQKELGIPNSCSAFDVNLGCSAAQIGIQVAASVLQQTEGDATALVLCGYAVAMDDIGKAPEDRMLFGSASSAVALVKDAAAKDIPFQIQSDGRRYKAIFRDTQDRFQMDGQAVFSFSIGDVTEAVLEYQNHFQIRNDDVDFFAFHQPQKLILDTVMSTLNVPSEKDLRCLEEYGNTSGSSALLALCANREAIQSKDIARIMTCGFGGGLSWCTLTMYVKTANILPIIVSDAVYET